MIRHNLNTGEMAKRADDMGRHIFKLLDDEILSADCILLDPKLLLTFRHCYDENEATFVCTLEPNLKRYVSEIEFVLSFTPTPRDSRGVEIFMFSNSESEATPRPELISQAEDGLMVNLFRLKPGLWGLKALWLWQCQRNIICGLNHALRPGWARKVEVIYNWIRFFTRPLSIQQILPMENMFLIEAKRAHRDVYDLFHHPKFEDFVLVYGGLKTAITNGVARSNVHHDIMWRLKYPVEEVAETRISIQDHADKFDAKFICSGPFKFQLTDDFTSHLTFSPDNDRTILLFFDSHQCPGTGLLIFKNNVIIGR